VQDGSLKNELDICSESMHRACVATNGSLKHLDGESLNFGSSMTSYMISSIAF